MNFGLRAQRNRVREARFIIALIAFVHVQSIAFADGCFVVPKFVWDKHKDINEPTQKAIIVHNGGREELILQVKYDGPVAEFGWLVPTPNLPTVEQGSMECFYELSKLTQKYFGNYTATATLSLEKTNGADGEEPPVKVIEIKTVGVFDIAVLSTQDSGALETWLKVNQFALPPNAAEVIEEYVRRRWYFVAVKVNLNSGASVKTAEQLASGELHPLQISFASEHCVFPLKISSLNNKLSEVQLYVISAEPLIERKMFETDLANHFQRRTNQQAELKAWREQPTFGHYYGRNGRVITNWPSSREPADTRLGDRSELHPSRTIDVMQVGRRKSRFAPGKSRLSTRPTVGGCRKRRGGFSPKRCAILNLNQPSRFSRKP